MWQNDEKEYEPKQKKRTMHVKNECINIHVDRKTDRQTDRQTGRQIEEDTDRRTNRIGK